jgi:WD40 repeat protein
MQDILDEVPSEMGELYKRIVRSVLANMMRDNVFLDSWSKDLLRLVTKFGRHLTSHPSCITNLIALFCPTDSAIHRQFASSNRMIKFAGAASTTWDDCSATIVMDDSARTFACMTDRFVVGTETGRVVLFEEQLCQRIKILQHGEGVKRVLFGPSTNVIIAVGSKTINCWDIDGRTHKWSVKVPPYLISCELISNDHVLFATFGSNEIRQWAVESGEPLEQLTWLEDELDNTWSLFRRPSATALAADENLLAIIYRGEDVTIWDIERGAMRDVLSKVDGSLGPTAPRRGGMVYVKCMQFSRAPPESPLLVVSYIDATMNLYDLDDGKVKATASITAHIMASNNAGTILACGESGGTVSLWEFDQLKPLHRIQAGIASFRQLAFSANDSHIYGVQGRYCYVWDPPFLLSLNMDEDIDSDAASVATAVALETKMRDPVTVLDITCLETFESGNFTFCGRDDGSVCLYQTSSGRCDSVLIQHAKNVAISCLAWDPVSLILVSVDVSSRVLVNKMQASVKSGFEVVSTMMDIKVGSSVQQLLLSPGGLNILVSTEQEDCLFGRQPDRTYCEQTRVSVPLRESAFNGSRRKWCTNPRHPDQLILIHAGTAKLYLWASLQQLASGGDLGIRLSGIKDPSLSVFDIQACFDDTSRCHICRITGPIRSLRGALLPSGQLRSRIQSH